MMKTAKRRAEFYSFYNHTGIEAHLTQMAKEGWMIEGITNLWWKYRRIEPRHLHFCVTYYPRASDFDPEPADDQQTFHDFCAHTGWKLACTWHQMQVFYNEAPSPIPLESDPVMEVDTLHRACKKNFLPSYWVMLVLSLLMSCYFVAGVILDPIGLLSDASRLVTEFAYLILFAISSVELATYFRWHRKAKAAAPNGVFVDTPSTVKFQIVSMTLVLIVAVWWLLNLFAGNDPLLAWVAVLMLAGMLGILILINAIKYGLKKAGASRGFNRFLTLAACFILPTVLFYGIVYGALSMDTERIRAKIPEEPIPLSVSDFMDVDENDYVRTNDRHHTFLLDRMNVDVFPHWEAKNRSELPELRYDITVVKFPALYGWCKAEMLKDRDETGSDIPEGHRNVYREADPAPWGAGEAYRLYNEEGWWMNTYLLCYEGRIVEITFDWEPTAEDMAVVSEKLKP